MTDAFPNIDLSVLTDRGGRLRGKGDRPHCHLCGCLLSHPEHVPAACGPCHRSRRDYNPALDPVFDRALEELFLEHPGVVVRPLLALGVNLSHKEAVRCAVRRLRRRGMSIAGQPHCGGYVYEPVPPRAGR